METFSEKEEVLHGSDRGGAVFRIEIVHKIDLIFI